jgi:trehalose 6-phosphate synthase/phosphatase
MSEINTLPVMRTVELIKQYLEAQRRLILLDYDGTLTRFADTPDQAIPSPGVLTVLKALASDKRNHVAIVSGRNSSFLEKWLSIENLTLIAEHGCGIKTNSDTWKFEPVNDSWMARIKPIIEMFSMSCPGSFIETKKCGLVWHYRMMDAEFGNLRAFELIDLIKPLCSRFQVEILRGNKVIEIRSAGINKGSVCRNLLACNTFDFVMAVGDDKTDEDMFKTLPPGAHTIKVGFGLTSARFRIMNPEDVVQLLGRLAMASAHHLAEHN